MQFYINIILDIESQQDVMMVNMREVVTNEEKKERIIAHNNHKYKIGTIRCRYTSSIGLDKFA